MKLKNRVVLVTGSAHRVGKATALLFALKGAKVVVHYRSNEQKARETQLEIAALTGKQPLLVQGDISRAADWRRMKKEILAKHSQIDVLVNNAAIFYETPFMETTEEQWDHFMDVNLKGAFLGCRIIGETMAQTGGKIINIADVAVKNVWQNFIPYCVSKAGVVALTRGLAKALAPTVTVNAVAPGTVLLAENYDDELEKRLMEKTPLKRVGTPEDVARAVVFLVEGSDFINGAVIEVDGGRSLV